MKPKIWVIYPDYDNFESGSMSQKPFQGSQIVSKVKKLLNTRSHLRTQLGGEIASNTSGFRGVRVSLMGFGKLQP